LPFLEELILFDNLIESLPTNIGSFNSLKKLDVEKNRLFGPLFNADFANLADTLEFLLASDQQTNGGFTGTIPTYIGTFTNLKELALSKNRFSGSIPAQITELQSLRESTTLFWFETFKFYSTSL
jgi:Leucine-rich repeat (LRR) protein